MNIGDIEISGLYIGTEEAIMACLGDEVVWEAVTPTPSYADMPLTIKVTSPGVLNLCCSGNSAFSKTLMVKFNDDEWDTITTSPEGTNWNVYEGDIIQLKGDNDTYGSGVTNNTVTAYYNTFNGSTAGFEIYGNILSLADSTDWTGVTSIGTHFVSGMFRGCTGLTSAENLVMPSFTNIDSFLNLFKGSTGLVKGPSVLPAAVLSYGCYADMFDGCTSLVESPLLPAKVGAQNCYYQMFTGCSSLSAITCLLSNPGSSWQNPYTSNWVAGVASAGTFTKASGTTWYSGANAIPTSWSVEVYTRPDMTGFTLDVEDVYGEGWAVPVVEPFWASSAATYVFSSSTPSIATVDNNGKITVVQTGQTVITAYETNLGLSASSVVTCYDYKDQKYVPLTFEIIDAGTASSPYFGITLTGVSYNNPPSAYSKYIHYVQSRKGVVINEGDIRAYTTYNSAQTASTSVTASFPVCQTGDVFELYSNTSSTAATYGGSTSIYHKFVNTAGMNISVYGNINSLLVSKSDFSTYVANQLSSIGSAASYTFEYLFQGRSGWTFNAPSEKKHIVLPVPANGLQTDAYHHMFEGCSSMVTAPALTATTLAGYCYSNMFQGCTGLTTAPSLPATSLHQYCYYYMFQGCTSLTSAPALPATSLHQYCYYYMFQGCTSLTSAPALPATTLSGRCYTSMFRDCTSLTTAPELPATALTNSSYQYMFAGCTNLVNPPSVLPAATVLGSSQANAGGTYSYMFQNCTSLTHSPVICATTIQTGACSYMFQGCSNLTSITCFATNIQGTSTRKGTYNWVNGVAANGTFTKDPNMSSWETGDNGIPTNWTVVDYAPAITALTITSPQVAQTVHTGDRVQVYYEPTGASVNLQYSVNPWYAGSIDTAGTITVDQDEIGVQIVVEDMITNLTADTVCDFSTQGGPTAGTYDVICDYGGGNVQTDTYSNGEIPFGQYQNSYINSVVIGDGIWKIGEYAFCDNNNTLTSATLGSGLTLIEGQAFQHSPLTSITIPASVTGIGMNAFNAPCGEMIFEGLTPPQLLNDGEQKTFNDGTEYSAYILYVPDAAYNDYMNDYGTYSSRIRPISAR